MCHKTAVQNAQIDRFVENGMPQKIVKSVKYTLRKRAAAIAAAEARLRDDTEHDVAVNEQLTITPAYPKASTHTSVTPTPPTTITAAAAVAVAATATVTADLVNDVNAKKLQEVTAAVVAQNGQQVEEQQLPQPNAMPVLQMQSNVTATKRYSQFDEATTRATAAPQQQQEQQVPVAMQDKAKENFVKIPKLCGRFRKLQQQKEQEQQQQHPATTAGHMDALAKGTQMTKRFMQRLNMALETLQSSHLYTLLTKTTQPAHVIVICILAFVLLTVWPNIMDGTQHDAMKSSGDAQGATTAMPQVGNGSQSSKHPLAVIAYLGAFATHFGSQIWMTFVSGLSLYFSLPRHMFGQCQQILFPKYFALNATLSISMLILYVKYLLTTWSLATCIQLIAVALCAVVEVTVRLYLAPPMLRLMQEKYKIEGSIGSGQEVGSIVQGDLVQCPHYQRVHKSFRRIHMTIAIGNMIVLVSTCLHLYFIAAKIQIS